MSNYDTVDHILWPYDRPKEKCDVCCDLFDYDLTRIDRRDMCDRCASDYVHFKSSLDENTLEKSV